jgi:hypothetical protein
MNLKDKVKDTVKKFTHKNDQADGKYEFEPESDADYENEDSLDFEDDSGSGQESRYS